MQVIENKEYHNHEALGSTLLATLLKNAKKFKKIRDGELELRTKAMDFGNALHTLVLEPENFEELVIVDDRNIPQKIKDIYEAGVSINMYPDEVLTASGMLSASKKAKELLEKLERETLYMTPKEMELYELYVEYKRGKIIVTSSEYELLFAMRDKLLKLDKMKEWLEYGVKERSFFAEIDGVAVKCRPDLLIRLKNGKYVVVDLKTMGGEATPEEFAKSSANYLYFMQEALYREVLRQNGITVAEFIFAGVSKLEYSGADYFKHDYIALEQGEELFRKAVFKYKWCSEHNEWREGRFDFVDGGFKRVNEIILPNYVFYQYV